MTDTRRPGVCGSDTYSVLFHSSCFLRPILKVFGFNCFCVLLCFSVLSQMSPLTILNLLSFSLVSLSYSVVFLRVLFVLTFT